MAPPLALDHPTPTFPPTLSQRPPHPQRRAIRPTADLSHSDVNHQQPTPSQQVNDDGPRLLHRPSKPGHPRRWRVARAFQRPLLLFTKREFSFAISGQHAQPHRGHRCFKARSHVQLPTEVRRVDPHRSKIIREKESASPCICHRPDGCRRETKATRLNIGITK